MRFEFRRLVLVKRYLHGSLIVAIAPLVLLAILYDRYSTDLLNDLLMQRVEGDLQTTTVTMRSFLKTQVKGLENLVDLPEIGEVFQGDRNKPLSTQLLDFLYLETGNPDIYSIIFFDANGHQIRSVPQSARLSYPLKLDLLPKSNLRNVEIIGPVFPAYGRPGWFLLKKTVLRDGVRVGALAFRVRLSSLTELASTLSRLDVYEPRIEVSGEAGIVPISVVGTVAGIVPISVAGTLERDDVIFATSEDILPGWTVSLIRNRPNIAGPRDQIRYILLIVAILSGVAVVLLFVHMSEWLARLIVPLNNGAKAIAKGDFSVKISEKGPGELKSLAQSFNEMSSHLSSMIESRVDVERRAVLGNLAAGIAHEIRNPLTTVRTTIHGLQRSADGDEQRRMFQVVTDEIIRVDAIVEEFLTYARPREPSKEAIEIREIFNSIKALVSSTALEVGVNLTFTGDRTISIWADPAHFRQIMMNVVLNAIEAMPDGGYLTLRAYNENGFGIFSIKDTGIGIDEEELSKVMVPFFTTKKGGTGLGLSISAQLARTNGGTLDIESKKGMGTTVFLRMPTTKQDGSDE